MTDFEPWDLPHMSNAPNDSGMCQAEGFGCVVDGRPVAEMACVEPEPEPGFWQALFDFLAAPKFTP
jgi:hypothetical protein